MLIALALALPSASAAQSGRIATSCSSGYVSAVINREHKCLRAGEYCSLSYQRQYEHYGYECSRSYDPPRLRRRG